MPFIQAALMKNSHTAAPDSVEEENIWTIIKSLKKLSSRSSDMLKIIKQKQNTEDVKQIFFSAYMNLLSIPGNGNGWAPNCCSTAISRSNLRWSTFAINSCILVLCSLYF